MKIQSILNDITYMRAIKNIGLVLVAIFVGHLYSQTGQITIISDPTKAKVWVNNQMIGHTPIQGYSLPVGHYTIRVADPVSNISSTEVVTIVADSSIVLNIALQRDFGTIKVDSKPEGAEVFFTTRIGKTPLTDDRIIPGAYVVEIRHPNKRYKAANENLIVQKNSAANISKTLEKHKLLDGKAWIRIGLGTLTLGSGLVGAIAQHNDNNALAIISYSFGGLCLIGIEIVAFF